MICLHYQFIFAVIGANLYLVCKKYWSDLGKLFLGTAIGLSPILAMEINTHFYNSKILWQILLHSGEHHGGLPGYYFIVSGLLLLIFLIYYFRIRICQAALVLILLTLLAIDGTIYLPLPVAMWGCDAEGWFYELEQKAHHIIEQENLTNFNIINLAYPDPIASVQKFLLARDSQHKDMNLSEDYYSNNYLYILAPHDVDLKASINYEVNTFVPEATTSWKLSEDYDLILWSR